MALGGEADVREDGDKAGGRDEGRHRGVVAHRQRLGSAGASTLSIHHGQGHQVFPLFLVRMLGLRFEGGPPIPEIPSPGGYAPVPVRGTVLEADSFPWRRPGGGDDEAAIGKQVDDQDLPRGRGRRSLVVGDRQENRGRSQGEVGMDRSVPVGHVSVAQVPGPVRYADAAPPAMGQDHRVHPVGRDGIDDE